MTTPSLQAPMDVGFDYTRSLGPTLSAFMTGLAGRRILGSRSGGRVHVPPLEYDPSSLEPTGDLGLVEVSDVGTVVSWSWMERPLPGQPLQTPFAWALIRLDGADTPLLHAVDAPPGTLHTGLRVRARWTPSPVGSIRDIACFEPAPTPSPARNIPENAPPPPPDAPADGNIPDTAPYQAPPDSNIPDHVANTPHDSRNTLEVAVASTTSTTHPSPATPANAAGSTEKVTMVTTPIHLAYTHTASPEESRYLRGLKEGRIVGQRCPLCRKVYVPPRGACPTDGVPTTDDVELPDIGTITTFCIVNVPFPGQRTKPPYVHAAVLLDGADIPFSHLILGCPPEQVRMGMRVRAVWKPREQWTTSPQNIDHFEPTGEPDADYETYAEHL